jgi:hypothetical protein
MKFSSRTIAAAALFAAVGTPVMAADMVTATDPESVVAALGEIGYQGAKLEPLNNGRPSISVKISGSPTYIDFYDCAEDMTGCRTLLFVYAMDLKDGTTLKKANDWNADQITGRVYLDENGDPTLDYAFSTFDGVTVGVFEENVKLWDTKVGQVKDFFDF